MKKLIIILIPLLLFGCGAQKENLSTSSSTSSTSSTSESKTTSTSEEETTSETSSDDTLKTTEEKVDLDTADLTDSSTGLKYQKPENITQLVGSYSFSNPENLLDLTIPSPAIIQLQINEDGTYRKLVIEAAYDMSEPYLNNLNPMAYFDSSNTLKFLDNGAMSIENFNYLWINKVTYSRGILVSKFDKTYLVPLETNLVESSTPILNEDGSLDATKSVIDQSIGTWTLSTYNSNFNTFIVPETENEIDDFYNQYIVNNQTSYMLNDTNLEDYSSINSSNEFSDTKTTLDTAKTEEVYDVVKYPLGDLLTTDYFKNYITTVNDIFQTAIGPFISQGDTYAPISSDIIDKIYLESGEKADGVQLGFDYNQASASNTGLNTITIYRNGRILRNIGAQDGVYVIPGN
ncbi:hypothetical protein K6V43_10090 [Streptococcus suis]|nr:hypothetical protein [Streptococcus suis]